LTKRAKCVIIITVRKREVKTMTNNAELLIHHTMMEYQNLVRKSKAKNITRDDTLNKIYKNLNAIEDGMEYIINNYELEPRTIRFTLPRWERLKETRFA
jgi:hypothetical protein